MTRRAEGVAAAALAALAVLAAGCGSSAGASPPAPSTTPASANSLRLVEHDTEPAVTVDLGAPGPGPGDLFVFTGDVLDGSPTGPRIGRADGSCSTVGTAGNLVCQVVFSLPGGQLDLQTVIDGGPFFAGATGPVAVTGGTGTYRDARGDGTAVIPAVADPSTVFFVLDTRT